MPSLKRFARRLLELIGISRSEVDSEAADVTLTYIRRDDAEMAAAWDEARENIHQFLDQLADPKMSNADFYVKKRFDEGDQSEHIWLSDIHVDGSEFVGRVGNDPGVVTGVKYGDEARVEFGEISDWMVMLNDEMVAGGYTVELLLRRQSEQA